MSDGTRVRSPNYPAFSLKEAVDRVGVLYRAIHRNPAPREVIAKGLGYAGLNGASATAISALNKYGLLEGRGEDLRISDRAMTILNPLSKEERSEAVRAAATEPKLFAELSERFPDGPPNEELLRNYLLRNGFATSAVASAIQAYRETSEFVALEAGRYESPSQPGKEIAMNTQNASSQPAAPPPPKVALHSAQKAEDGRVLHRFEFPDGGFVEIKVSHDVDAELALQLVETSLPTVKAITAIAEKARKATVSKSDDDGAKKGGDSDV